MVKATQTCNIEFCNGNKLKLRILQDSIVFCRNYVIVDSIADDAEEIKIADMHKYEIYINNVNYIEHYSDYKAVRVVDMKE